MSDTATVTTTETPTIEALLAMDEFTFRRTVTDDMHLVRQFNGPFQAREVIQRTLLALIDSLWHTNYLIEERAEDPNCSAELYGKTVKYRKHLLSLIDITDRRCAFFQGVNARKEREWKAVLHQVVDAILAGKDDDEILEIRIPGFGEGGGLTLETWHEIRRAKDPRRIEVAKEAA